MIEFVWAVECETSWRSDGRSIDAVVATFTTLEAARKWLGQFAEKVANSEGYDVRRRTRDVLTYSTKNSTNRYTLFQLPLYTEEDIDGPTQ